MTITEIKHYLKEKKTSELIKIITSLYNLDSKNRDFIESLINPENDVVLFEKYKQIIEHEFFPPKGDPKLRYSAMRTAITDFKKICKKPEHIANLMLHYVYYGVKFTNAYGDIDEAFYMKMENMYTDALNYIFKHDLEKKFDEFCLKIKMGSEGTGWGFEHAMDDIYYAFYNDDDWMNEE